MRKILFVCTHGIGDLIMTLPAVRAVANAGGLVSLLVKGRVEEEVGRELLCNLEIEYKHLNHADGGRKVSIAEIVRWIRRCGFDYAFAQYGVDPLRFAVLSVLGGAATRVGWHGTGSWLNTQSLRSKGNHKVLENARLLDVLGIDYSVEDLYFKDCRRANDVDAQKVLLAPSAGETAAHRAWPKEKYAELAAEIVGNFDVDIEILGGADDIELCEFIAAQTTSGRATSLAGKLDIRELFALLKKREIVIANCNGVSHMAASVGLSIIGIYGPTSPLHTGPFTPRLTAISRNLDCSPCYRRGFTEGCGKPVCMTEISVAEVYAAASLRLREFARVS